MVARSDNDLSVVACLVMEHYSKTMKLKLKVHTGAGVPKSEYIFQAHFSGVISCLYS